MPHGILEPESCKRKCSFRQSSSGARAKRLIRQKVSFHIHYYLCGADPQFSPVTAAHHDDQLLNTRCNPGNPRGHDVAKNSAGAMPRTQSCQRSLYLAIGLLDIRSLKLYVCRARNPAIDLKKKITSRTRVIDNASVDSDLLNHPLLVITDFETPTAFVHGNNCSTVSLDTSLVNSHPLVPNSIETS